MNDLKGEMRDTVSSATSSVRNTQTAKNATETQAESVQAQGLRGKELPGQATEIAGLNEEQLSEAVSKINQYVQNMERTLDFQVDEDSGRTVIKVFDSESEKLIRQIPSELALTLAQKLNDDEPTLLFSAKV
ncbi:flagellar protein FlaG [Bacterioplanoides sp.]|uniref:flagellar protein FlaG n=1 Tax=Bacterioplanoides sp. TaxID=2066072 RepID=UPI003B5974AD